MKIETPLRFVNIALNIFDKILLINNIKIVVSSLYRDETKILTGFVWRSFFKMFCPILSKTNRGSFYPR